MIVESSYSPVMEELQNWLQARGNERKALHERSRALRDQVFGRSVFIRAVIEVSNVCRQNCIYCGMRRDNQSLDRFRLELKLLRDIVFEQLPPSVTDINIQTGEDPIAVREIIIPLIREIRQHTKLGISVCLGTHEAKLYSELLEAGAEFCIIKLETGNEDHYRKIQAPGTFSTRMQTIERSAADGWLVSSGLIYGLPYQTQEHIAETLQRLSILPLVGNSVSPFIPGTDTPSAHHPAADLETTINLVAAMRMINPRRIIPAVSAMNCLQKDGYEQALRAGANLATINLTPEIQRGNYLLYKKDRVIMDERRVLDTIEAADLNISKVSLIEYLKNNNLR